MPDDKSPLSTNIPPLDEDQKLSKDTSTEKLTAEDFKGFFAPILSCFHDDEMTSLNVSDIEQYAAWLKAEQIRGICVNSIYGEGPALGYSERRQLVEAWWQYSCQYKLLMIVQVGGAPLPDVLQMAEHAEDLGVHAVMCLPELFYKPNKIEQLVGFCRKIAKKCPTRPFLYYHMPKYTEVKFDMNQFCDMAEQAIPNFLGIAFASPDLDIASQCLRDGRVVFFTNTFLMVAASFMGFESFMCSCITVRPDIARSIIFNMNAGNLQLAKERQTQLNKIYRYYLNECRGERRAAAIKMWFNLEDRFGRGPGITAGPARKYFLKKTIY